MTKNDVKKMGNAQLLCYYTIQSCTSGGTEEKYKELKWVLEELAKRLGGVDKRTIGDIMEYLNPS